MSTARRDVDAVKAQAIELGLDLGRRVLGSNAAAWPSVRARRLSAYKVSREMPCSAQNVVTAPPRSVGKPLVVARRTQGSTGSTALMPQTMSESVRTKHRRSARDLLMYGYQRCPDT